MSISGIISSAGALAGTAAKAIPGIAAKIGLTSAQGWANLANLGIGTAATLYNRKQAQNLQNYQTDMANSAYQRQVEDLRKAGLNPILAAGGTGAATPAGAMSQASETTMNPDYFMQTVALGTMAANATAKGVEVAMDKLNETDWDAKIAEAQEKTKAKIDEGIELTKDQLEILREKLKQGKAEAIKYLNNILGNVTAGAQQVGRALSDSDNWYKAGQNVGSAISGIAQGATEGIAAAVKGLLNGAGVPDLLAIKNLGAEKAGELWTSLQDGAGEIGQKTREALIKAIWDIFGGDPKFQAKIHTSSSGKEHTGAGGQF